MTVGSISAGGLYYKVLGNSVTLTTANTISNAKLVRLINIGGSYETITHVNAAANTTQGTLVMGPLSEIVMQKKPLDTFASTAAANTIAVPVSFSN